MPQGVSAHHRSPTRFPPWRNTRPAPRSRSHARMYGSSLVRAVASANAHAANLRVSDKDH
ncbi:MAG: hypothetical protein R2711_09155 [Acidimicrobiales bacterium]